MRGGGGFMRETGTIWQIGVPSAEWSVPSAETVFLVVYRFVFSAKIWSILGVLTVFFAFFSTKTSVLGITLPTRYP